VKPRLSISNASHRGYPYLLRVLAIIRSNQVRPADITYLPMAKRFFYLVVIMDWASRVVMSWRLSNPLDSAFCIDAMQEVNRYGCPEIFNPDEGCQFTADVFTDILYSNNIAISMDGQGWWQDNSFIERLWRSVQYEDVYLKPYADAAELRGSLSSYFKFDNEKRWHQNFDRKTPSMVYFDNLHKQGAA